MAFKYGIKDTSALKFDKPIEPEDTYSYDFSNDWTINPAQTGGVEVTDDHTITITKFKPNEWFIKSNYATMTQEQFLAKFYNIDWSLSGLSANSAKFTRVETSTYKPMGLVITPVNAQNVPMDPGAMNVAGGSFKNPNHGWASYGYVVGNGTYKLYNYACYNANYPQVALFLHSAVEPDGDGFITLDSPITISEPNLADNIPVNPSSVEGFQGYLGNTQVYDKPMTFNNVLSAYGFVFKEVGNFVEEIQGSHPAIVNSYSGESNVAFVVSCRGYNGVYGKLRLPEIIDLGTLIQNNYPVKFWAQLEAVSGHSNFWDSVADAFANNEITDEFFLNHLFTKSSGNIQDLYLNINSYREEDGGTVDNYLDLMGIFDYSSVARNIHFNITHGYLKSIVNAFRQTKNINSITFNRPVFATDWSGAFEGTKLTSFPTNLGPGHQWNGTYSQITTDMHYAADGSSLQWFGDYQNSAATLDEEKYYIAVVTPGVYGMISRSNVQEIRYIMDFKFVIPKAWCVDDGWYGNAIFNASNLTTAKIKNINKGDWSLDGVARQNQHGNICCGDISNFDANSANYMLFNIFDLKRNDQATGDTERFENELNSFNGWTLSSGTKRPIVMETWPNTSSTFSRSVTAAGIMKVKVGLTNCTLTMTNGGNTVTINGGDQTLNIATGNCTFTFTKTGDNAKGSLELDSDFHFLSELTPGLTNCSIYLPASLKSKVSSLAIQTAQERGWNVYFGGELEPVITLEPCTFQFELDGESYADNNSNNEIRFYNKAGYHDSFTMEAPGTSIGSVNTSFETVSIPANTQHTNVYVTKSSTPFIVTISDDEVSKEMQVNYTFDGDRNGQAVTVYAHFKNLTNTSEPIKTLELIEGSGQYEYLELDDWFVSGGSVRVQVSFDLIAN